MFNPNLNVMKIFEYQRVSTSAQEVAQQHNAVQQYIDAKGWEIDETVSDEGVSGGVSYKDRNLYKLIQRMSEGDVLIVSEISRLGRSMSDLSKLVNDELKPRKLRLIVVKMGLDIDCSNIRAIDEMILFAFSFASQLEKELIRDRTQSAIDVRKQKIANGESFVSKSGRVCTSLGRPKGCAASDNAIKASCQSRRDAAKNNEHNLNFKRYLDLFENRHGKIMDGKSISEFVQELNALGFRTARGMEFDVPRAWNMVYKIRKLYVA